MFGQAIKERMNLFEISTEELAEKTMMDSEYLDSIIGDKIAVEDIDLFDIEVLANALLCDIDYFFSSAVRDGDVVFISKNKDKNTAKSNLAKAKMQNYMRDLIIVKDSLA